MKRIVSRIGGMAAVLLAIWCFRAEPNLPAIGEGPLFRERPSASAADMVDMVLDTPPAIVASQVWVDSDYDPTETGIGGIGSRPSLRSGSAFTAPSPQMLQAPRSASRSGGAGGGLFDTTTLDPFSEKVVVSDASSWGWLADEVGSTERTGIRNHLSRRTSEQRRSLLNDGDEGRFRTELGSGSGFYFRRMDESF